jgi:hypothetical protein
VRTAARTLALLACLALSACGGANGFSPSPSSSQPATLDLNPSPVDLTSDDPSAVITAQGDVAGVQYTAHADSSCTNATGSLAVAGDGIAQLDVAGSPLLFIAVATGTPPASCTMSVTGSDGSFVTVAMDYSVVTLEDDVMNAATLRRLAIVRNTVAPASVTIDSPTDVVMVNLSGFSGLTKSRVSCSGTPSGVGLSIIPSSFTGSGTVAVAPYGQGALSGTCTVSFTDATAATQQLTVTLAAAALNKLTVTPSSVQFACAGSSPQTCTTPNVTIAESGATLFKINNRPTLVNSCANLFNGPLKMSTGGGSYASSVAGPQATVSFYGLLLTSTLSCKKIVIGDGGAQTVAVHVNASLASGGTAATAPSCTGSDPLAPAANAPHGMYVWNPYREGGVEKEIEQYVLGPGTGPPLDADFCGASIVVVWSDIETSKGSYDWSAIDTLIAPYARPGLRVNLLLSDASEECCTNTETPSWIFSQEGVGQVQCPGQPPYPNWLDPTFEKDYKAFIDAMIAHFSSGGGDQYTSSIGYMRFGIGAGVEAYPGHLEGATTSPQPCLDAWKAATPAFSYTAWLNYTLGIVHNLAQQTSDKQLMVSLNYVSMYDSSNPNDAYSYADAVADVAAPLGVAMGVQNLGISFDGVPVAGANVAPTACDQAAQSEDIYWCQVYMRHDGVVPFEFQPIVSPISPGGYDITIAHIFQYGMINNAQIFEIYPQDWVFKDDPAEYPSFTAATQAQYQAAFSATSLVLGRNH